MKTDRYLPISCNSVFEPYITEYVGLKRAFGFTFNTETEILNIFDKFCLNNSITNPVVSRKVLDAWETKRENESKTTHQLRVRVVRGLSEYLYKKGLDTPHIFHPLPDVNKDFVPYIFSETEINRLMKAVDLVTGEQRNVSPIRHLVMPVLFRTVYGCGLRINEALQLKREEISLESRTIRIINAKDEQDRIVVMSDSLANMCRHYASQPEIQNYESPFFFPAPDHSFYSNRTVYEVFRKALFVAGIPHRGRNKGPRVHDLRHTFAVHVLSNWQRQGKDIYVCLPILSDYLGHKSIYSTERYLQLVPESYSQVTDPFNNAYPEIFPEV